MKVSKTWLQGYFEQPLPETEELVRLLTFGVFEVEEVVHVGDDDVLEVKVLPDRSSYALSHRGIAKEISALIQQPLKKDPLREPLPKWPASKELAIEVNAPELCLRYMGAVVHGVTVGPSPEWLQRALASLGQKSINNIVDATNYVMYNLGQPLHAFDFAKLEKKENRATITVRRARNGEKITVLSGETFEVTTDDLLITDGVSDTPLAVAGIKGGKQAELDVHTTDIVLEAAHFNYVAVRKTSRKLKLVTDASVRFQNEPSPELVGYALHAVVQLVTELAGGEPEGVVDVCAQLPAAHTVSVTLKNINTLLGTNIEGKEVENIFSHLGFVYKKEGDTFTVTPPFERTDLNIPEDFVEEVGRVYGYENIKAMVPLAPKETPAVNKRFYYTEKVRHLLAELGFSEVYTYTLRPKGEVELENPLASDKACMRANLTDGVTESLALNAYNAPLLGLDAVKIFEIGTVFKKEGEYTALAFGVKNTRIKKPKAEETLKEAQTALEKMFDCSIVGTTLGGVFECSLDALLPSLPDPKEYERVEGGATAARFAPFSPYPFMLRDIALWVPEVKSVKEVEAIIQAEGGDLLSRCDLFDQFIKDGRVSYAFHLVFQSKEKTLTDSEVGERMLHITEALVVAGGEVR